MPRGLHVLPPTDLESMRGWNKLDSQEKSSVKSEFKAITEALHSEGQSRLSIGKHLLEVSSILSPKKMFGLFLKRHFHMGQSTAFNYINLWKAAAKDAPKNVLDIAMSRNYRIVNRPEVFKTYPPPKTTSTAKIIAYLDRLETRKPKVVTVHKNPDGLLKQALHSVELCWKKVPNTPKARLDWINLLIGMELSMFGLTQEKSFSPLPIPHSFVVVRGRPKEEKAA